MKDNLPVPDPTTLTTDALLREIGHMRELYDTRFNELNLRLQQRFEAQSKALDAALDTSQARSDVLSAKIEAIGTNQSKSTGKSDGLNAGWVILLGAIAALATVMTVVN